MQLVLYLNLEATRLEGVVSCNRKKIIKENGGQTPTKVWDKLVQNSMHTLIEI